MWTRSELKQRGKSAFSQELWNYGSCYIDFGISDRRIIRKQYKQWRQRCYNGE